MRFAAALMVLIVLALPARAFAGGAGVHSVTVVPFTALKDGGDGWLGKALADLVAQKLANSGKYEVLERDKLQEFLKEMDLQQSGFTDKDTLQRLGGLTQVDGIISGSYEADGQTLTLHLIEIDAKGQKAVQSANAMGSMTDLPGAADALVMDYLKRAGTPLTEDEAKNIHFRATDSTSALQHFYKGMNDYDAGKYEEAYGEFTGAIKQDDRYLDAQLWAGKMLEYLGMNDQAVIAYTKLHDAAPASVEGLDGLFFAAKLSESAAPDKAVEDYKILAALLPRTPHSLEADVRLSKLYAKQGKPAAAFRALQDLNGFREDVDKRRFAFAAEQIHNERRGVIASIKNFLGIMDDAREDNMVEEVAPAAVMELSMRQSRFFGWSHALNLYRGATMEMVALYRDAAAEDPTLKPPRGTFFVDAAAPKIGEERFGDAKSLFFDDTKIYPQWQEKFYAAVVPKGYTAEGVTLHVTGYVPSPTTTTDFTLRVFGFPLMKNFYNNWLGTVYGQTASVTSLQKDVAFHGRDRDILVFQLIENAGKIKNWSVDFKLRKTEGEKPVPAPAKTDTFFEGKEIARLRVDDDGLPGVSDPQYVEQYAPKKRIALADFGKDGDWLVVSRGDLRTGQTDLFGAYSKDGKDWPALKPLSVNSMSQDFAPKLVRAEDGAAHLFWLSNRRGLGWEIWHARAEGENWSEPARVPADKLLQSTLGSGTGADMPGFDAIQDKQGRWILAICAPGQKGVRLLSSDDLEKWDDAGTAGADRVFFDPAFLQDAAAVYWLGAIDGDARLDLMKSNDLKSWQPHDYDLGSYSRHWSTPGNGNYGSVEQIAGFPMTLFDAGDRGVTLLFSDTLTGLQYATFNPDVSEPRPDLVREISLEPYAAARAGEGYLLAQWQGDDIVLRRYSKFALPMNAWNAAEDPLYRETEADKEGNIWDRRIARTRYVMSDVTAVGAAPDGRAWWGIETGVMALKDKDFFVSDVSMGFFYHQVTDIVPCGDRIWFAAKTLDKPELGVMRQDHLSNSTDRRTLSDTSGHVTAITCGDGMLFVGTSAGDVQAIKGEDAEFTVHLPASYATAIGAGKNEIWIGTHGGGVYRSVNGKLNPMPFQKELGAIAVNGLAVGTNGDVWMSTDGGGLYRHSGGKWAQYTPLNSAFPYYRPGKLEADGDGVLFMPGPYEASRGIGWFDGEKAALYDPPSHNIYDMIDFDRAPDGSVWVGSESSGIYRFERKKP